MIQLSRKKNTGLVGLEIEAGSVAAVELTSNGDAYVSATAIAPLPAGAFSDGEVTDSGAVAAILRDLFAEHGLSRRVRLGIGNQRLVVRTLRLPAIEDPNDLELAVRSQAQEQIPMPLEQAVLDHRVVGGIPAADGAPAQVDVIVVAGRRDMIEATLAPVTDAGLEPIGVDLSAFGLIRALGQPAVAAAAKHEGEPERDPGATLYCNVSDVTNLAIANGRSCLFTRVSPHGLEAISSGLSKATGLSDAHARMWLSHVGLEQAPEEVAGDPATVEATRSALQSGASSVLDELRLSLDFYGGQQGAAPVTRIVLSGPGSAIPGFAGGMGPALGLPLAVGRPEALASVDPAAAARLTVPYGLAMDG